MSIPLASPWGYRQHPITGRWHLHNGIDIPLPIGTPLRAARPGVVTRIDWDTPGKPNGNAVFVRDRWGYTWVYLHLHRVLVSRGQPVVAHQVLGLSGNTGRSTGPHLHFTVYTPQGESLNPLRLYPRGVFEMR